MPAYHSQYNEQNNQIVCNMAVLPLKTKFKGPAPVFNGGAEDKDIIDEAIDFFKANVLFRNFEVQGPADRVLIYCTLYISQCLSKFGTQNKANAEKAMFQLAIENFSVPGDAGFVLGGIVSNPANRNETDTIRQYFTQLRQEIGKRIVERVYKDINVPDKWWMAFSKRKFLNKAL